MSPRGATPARTHALLIGIESYEAGRAWELDGPAGDVMDVYDWLVSRDVPPNQIDVLASPLASSQTRLAEANISYKPAVSSMVRRKLDELQKKEGDLLFLFWAGHGAYNDREHRLFFADATTANKRNLEWDRLRESLLSTYFRGFPCQIVIVDACADFRNDFSFSAPGEAIPAGQTIEREQFVLFATLIGQAAANLDREQRGLFTKHLLKAFQSDKYKGAWPPNMPEIAASVREELEKLQGAGGGQVPRFESHDWQGNTDVFTPDRVSAALDATPIAERDRLALVIGIGNYKNFAPKGEEPKPHQFRNLEFAAADARAIHDFLSGRPEYEVEPLLLDEQATYSGILRALNHLRKQCQLGNRTAVVDFSGHGARDDENHSYLVPHDAERNDLFATALWSKTFSNALEEFGKNRVVLLIDACHGGDFDVPGVKSGQLTGFNPKMLTEGLQVGERFLIASCQPQQRSYEEDGHGIFTHHILDLLRTDERSVFEQEQIDLFDLYEQLKPRVRKAARVKGVQEPFASFDRRTGFIVAINEVLRRERVERPVRYLEALLEELARQNYSQPLRLEKRLRGYIERKERLPEFNDFYRLFEEYLRVINLSDIAAIERDCLDLIEAFDKATSRSQRPQVTSNRRPGPDRISPSIFQNAAQDVAAPPSPALDAPVDSSAKSLLGAAPVMAVAPLTSEGSLRTPAARAGAPEDRRILTVEDVVYIMGETLKDKKDPAFPVLYQLMKKLQADGGVLESDADDWMVRSAPQVPAGREATIQAILGRFEERFRDAKPIQSASALYLRVGKTD